MLDVKRRIEVITDLVAQRTPASVAYAALECRLTIEYLCYERLKMSLDTVALADLKAWQPSKVVKAVEELANEEAASSLTLSFAPEPILPPGQELTLEERANLKYVKIGTQSAIDLRKTASLWNALANAALHVQLPKSKTDSMSIYGDIDRTLVKVEECLVELRSIATGNLLSNGFGRDVWIDCDRCSYRIKRRVDKVKDGQVISCINPNCDESYTVSKEGDDIYFTPRLITLNCNNCDGSMELPMKQTEKLKVSDYADVYCPKCKARHVIRAQLAYALVSVSDAPSKGCGPTT